MAIDNDMSNLIVTIDTREQDKQRIDTVKSFFESQNAIVERKALKRCDYSIEGIYRGVEINLGIEHKVLTGDFFPSLQDMPNKFIESYQYYNDVALFIEEGNYSATFTENNLDAFINSPSMQAATGLEGVGRLSQYQNFLNSMYLHGIYVRPYKTVVYLPITIMGLLGYITKQEHRGLKYLKPDSSYKIMLNMLACIDGIGIKTIEKLLKYSCNLERLCNFSNADLIEILGKARGKRVYNILHMEDRKEECCKEWDKFYAETAPKAKIEVDSQIQANKQKKAIDTSTSIIQKVPYIKKDELNNIGSIPDTPILPIKDSLPSKQNVLEFIRKKPRSFDDINTEFQFSKEYGLKLLADFQTDKKIWYDSTSKKWTFGVDKNPVKIVADTEFDIGV